MTDLAILGHAVRHTRSTAWNFNAGEAVFLTEYGWASEAYAADCIGVRTIQRAYNRLLALRRMMDDARKDAENLCYSEMFAERLEEMWQQTFEHPAPTLQSLSHGAICRQMQVLDANAAVASDYAKWRQQHGVKG